MRASTGKAVTDSAVPMKSTNANGFVVGCADSNSSAAPTPNANGSASEPKDTAATTRRLPRSSDRSTSIPTKKRKTTTPTFANHDNTGRTSAGNSAALRLSPISVGPSTMPARISPITAGWPSLLSTAPSSLATATMMMTSTTSTVLVPPSCPPDQAPDRSGTGCDHDIPSGATTRPFSNSGSSFSASTP
jgi:hypothetical protein